MSVHQPGDPVLALFMIVVFGLTAYLLWTGK